MKIFGKDVSIVILSWKDAHLLDEWLHAFFKFRDSNVTVEILVCDNGSHDPRMDEVIRKYSKHPECIFFKNPKNEYIPAINRFIPMLKGKYIMLAAPGAVFLNDVMDKLKNFLDAHPKTGAVSAKFLNIDNSFQNVYKKFSNIFMEILDRGFLFGFKLRPRLAGYFNNFSTLLPHVNPVEPFIIERTHLCAFMVRREALDSEPLIEEKIPLGPCDADLCKRIYKKGYTIYGIPTAKVRHERSASFGLYKQKLRRIYSLFGSLVYFKKHHKMQFPIFWALCLLDRIRNILTIPFVRQINLHDDLKFELSVLKLLFRKFDGRYVDIASTLAEEVNKKSYV